MTARHPLHRRRHLPMRRGRPLPHVSPTKGWRRLPPKAGAMTDSGGSGTGSPKRKRTEDVPRGWLRSMTEVARPRNNGAYTPELYGR
jgi:hypothetical protein